jgi:hypothetical protein
MPQKLRDLAVKTGSYTDSQGQEKGRWQNIGALMKSDDGGEFIILHRWFNPAGIPNPNNRDSLLVSCFKPQQQGQGQSQQSAPPPQQAQQPPQQQQPGPGAPAGSDFDDEIPFAAMHNMMGG